MAKVIVKVLGASPTEKEADTVGELAADMELSNHSATVNGQPANSDTELSDGQLVTFASSVKGGM